MLVGTKGLTGSIGEFLKKNILFFDHGPMVQEVDDLKLQHCDLMQFQPVFGLPTPQT